MYQDHYGLELSCASEAALQAYSAGIDCALRFDEPGITELKKATVEDGEFALAHAMLGRQLRIHGFNSEVAPCLEQATALKAGATAREQAAIDVIIASVSFNPDVLDMARHHVGIYPQDIAVLSQLVGPFGLLAFSGQWDWREQNVALLRASQARYPSDDWWHLATRGFMAAEMGDLAQAREVGERAWALSENGNCAHTLAHLHFEAHALDEGMAFIKNWKSANGEDSDMCHHLLWHLALLDQAGGARGEALMQMYASELDPDISDPMPLTTFSDNAALLWRCHLSGVHVPGSIARDLLRYADAHYPKIGFAFADIHRVMSTALLGDREQQQALVNDLADFCEDNDSEQARCLLPFAKGINAYANSDYAAVVELLQPVLPSSLLLGGSNPQRRVIEETYLAAKKCLQ